MKLPEIETPQTPDRIYLFSPDGGTGRDAVAIGLLHTLAAANRNLTVFQPILSQSACDWLEANADNSAALAQHTAPPIVQLIEAAQHFTGFAQGEHAALPEQVKPAAHNGLETPNAPAPADFLRGHWGVPQKYLAGNLDIVRRMIVSQFYESDAVAAAEAGLIIGADRSTAVFPEELALSAHLSADLQAPAFISVSATQRTAVEVAETVQACARMLKAQKTTVLGVFISPCPERMRGPVADALDDINLPIWLVPHAAESSSDSELAAYLSAVSESDVAQALATPVTTISTSPRFQYSLIAQARANKQTIVLPEGSDDRILSAANTILSLDAANIDIVGDAEAIAQRADQLHLDDLAKAKIIAPDDPELIEQMVPALQHVRPDDELTDGQARALLKDVNYFGTMLVQMGCADGMVSGAAHSTAATVRPALRVVGTDARSRRVSGAMIMCMDSGTNVYADVALEPNPTAAQIAEIARQTAETAERFGIDPIVGFLSYSTLGSGKGPDVELVREAVDLARKANPAIKAVGPIQFDAAWSPVVAAKKAPGNPYAGHVNVYVYPNLTAANIAVKAVERTSGAVAIGPILQGLNKPISDLSRGVTHLDIVNTIAVTAILAQSANTDSQN